MYTKSFLVYSIAEAFANEKCGQIIIRDVWDCLFGKWIEEYDVVY